MEVKKQTDTLFHQLALFALGLISAIVYIVLVNTNIIYFNRTSFFTGAAISASLIAGSFVLILRDFYYWLKAITINFKEPQIKCAQILKNQLGKSKRHGFAKIAIKQ